MSGDLVIWITLGISFLFINVVGLIGYKTDKLHLLVYGICIVVLAPVYAVLLGYVFSLIETGDVSGGSGFGAAFAAAFIGFAIVGNGIIYVICGIFISIRKALKKRKEVE